MCKSNMLFNLYIQTSQIRIKDLPARGQSGRGHPRATEFSRVQLDGLLSLQLISTRFCLFRFNVNLPLGKLAQLDTKFN